MPANETDHLNLSGTWNGVYGYPDESNMVPFNAILTDAGGWLTGTTQETGTVGEARGHKISATLQGRRTDDTVTWLKTYDGVHRWYDVVQYSGAVSDDATEIQGIWTIPNSWSGTFLMVRASGKATSLTREADQKIKIER